LDDPGSSTNAIVKRHISQKKCNGKTQKELGTFRGLDLTNVKNIIKSTTNRSLLTIGVLIIGEYYRSLEISGRREMNT
jgi:hypothetical protein